MEMKVEDKATWEKPRTCQTVACIRIIWKNCENRLLGPTLRDPGSAGVKWGPRTNKFPGDANCWLQAHTRVPPGILG